ncbi:MAG: glucosamine-6-phosphate deaminase, partial [Firmicutes bacterium]|nr:glucosamine-6-phosphate deaminase [Bacillota bacterium]
MFTPERQFTKDKLRVEIYPNREAMGKAAAAAAISKIREVLTEKDEVNVVFAAAPSQNEFQ